MIPTTGLNVFRTACANSLDTGIAGTGTTAPDLSDTALVTPVSATEIAVTIIESTSSFQVTHFIPSTIGTSNTFTEWGILDTSNVLLSRVVTAGISHTSNDEITKITVFNVVDR